MATKTINTPIFRGSFVQVFKARAMEGNDTEKFGIVAIFKPDADLSELMAEVKRAAVDKWGSVPEGCKNPFRDQSTKDYDGFGSEGKFLNLTSLQKPGIVDEALDVVTDDTKAYSGAYFRASVRARAYEKGSKGVALDLCNLQFIEHGERLGGRTDPLDEFTAVEGAEKKPAEGDADLSAFV